MPDNANYNSWLSRESGETAAPSLSGKDSGSGGSQGVLKAFVKRGLENPAKTLTRKGFREYYVKAVIQEDLPYSFGNKDGIKALFEYVLPAGFVLPSQFVVRADLDRLYNELSTKLSQKILVSDKLSFNDELARITC